MHRHRELIAQALKEHLMPQDAAAKALAEAGDNELEGFAREGAMYLARLMARRRPDTSTTPTGQNVHDNHVGVAGGGRWVLAAEQSWDLTLPYYTADGWKPLGECSVEDLAFIAEAYEARAAQNEAHARRFRDLADTLRRAGVSTVAALAERAA